MEISENKSWHCESKAKIELSDKFRFNTYVMCGGDTLYILKQFYLKRNIETIIQFVHHSQEGDN